MMSEAAGEAAGPWPGPLGGVKVLDLTRVLAGPFLTQVMGDLGAEILKIETPGHGDETRTFAPFVHGESHYFIALNRQKKSLGSTSARRTAPTCCAGWWPRPMCWSRIFAPA